MCQVLFAYIRRLRDPAWYICTLLSTWRWPWPRPIPYVSLPLTVYSRHKTGTSHCKSSGRTKAMGIRSKQARTLHHWNAQYIATTAAAENDDCCLNAALANWTICNLYAGCRGIEWKQTDSQKQNLHSHHLNQFNNACAFTPQDVQCTTASNQILTLQEAIQNPNNVGCIRLRFEEQKNGENGEKKLFVRNHKNSFISFVQTFLQILIRHAKLANAHPKLPLSIYRHHDGRTCNITSADVETCIRNAASKLFSIDPVINRKELQMWSSHLLRVGACTTLYAMGFHEMEIKHLLQWKSNAFMTYLCNLAVTSRHHNNVLASASCIPNFS